MANPLPPACPGAKSREPIDDRKREFLEIGQLLELLVHENCSRFFFLVAQRLSLQAKFGLEPVEPSLPAVFSSDHRRVYKEAFPAPRGSNRAGRRTVWKRTRWVFVDAGLVFGVDFVLER